MTNKSVGFIENELIWQKRLKFNFQGALTSKTLCGVVNTSNAIKRGMLRIAGSCFTMVGKLTQVKKYCKRKISGQWSAVG